MCFRWLKEPKLSSWSHLSSRWLAPLCAEEYNGSRDSGQKTHSSVTPSATNAVIRFGVPGAKIKGTVVLTSLRTRGILGGPDILVDIGVFAEKEVIQ